MTGNTLILLWVSFLTITHCVFNSQYDPSAALEELVGFGPHIISNWTLEEQSTMFKGALKVCLSSFDFLHVLFHFLKQHGDNIKRLQNLVPSKRPHDVTEYFLR